MIKQGIEQSLWCQGACPIRRRKAICNLSPVVSVSVFHFFLYRFDTTCVCFIWYQICNLSLTWAGCPEIQYSSDAYSWSYHRHHRLWTQSYKSSSTSYTSWKWGTQAPHTSAWQNANLAVQMIPLLRLGNLLGQLTKLRKTLYLWLLGLI